MAGLVSLPGAETGGALAGLGSGSTPARRTSREGQPHLAPHSELVQGAGGSVGLFSLTQAGNCKWGHLRRLGPLGCRHFQPLCRQRDDAGLQRRHSELWSHCALNTVTVCKCHLIICAAVTKRLCLEEMLGGPLTPLKLLGSPSLMHGAGAGVLPPDLGLG